MKKILILTFLLASCSYLDCQKGKELQKGVIKESDPVYSYCMNEKLKLLNGNTHPVLTNEDIHECIQYTITAANDGCYGKEVK